MPPATDKADPWGQFLNTFMCFTKGTSHLFLLQAIQHKQDIYSKHEANVVHFKIKKLLILQQDRSGKCLQAAVPLI